MKKKLHILKLVFFVFAGFVIILATQNVVKPAEKSQRKETIKT